MTFGKVDIIDSLIILVMVPNCHLSMIKISEGNPLKQKLCLVYIYILLSLINFCSKCTTQKMAILLWTNLYRLKESQVLYVQHKVVTELYSKSLTWCRPIGSYIYMHIYVCMCIHNIYICPQYFCVYYNIMISIVKQANGTFIMEKTVRTLCLKSSQ